MSLDESLSVVLADGGPLGGPQSPTLASLSLNPLRSQSPSSPIPSTPEIVVAAVTSPVPSTVSRLRPVAPSSLIGDTFKIERPDAKQETSNVVTVACSSSSLFTGNACTLSTGQIRSSQTLKHAGGTTTVVALPANMSSHNPTLVAAAALGIPITLTSSSSAVPMTQASGVIGHPASSTAAAATGVTLVPVHVGRRVLVQVSNGGLSTSSGVGGTVGGSLAATVTTGHSMSLCNGSPTKVLAATSASSPRASAHTTLVADGSAAVGNHALGVASTVGSGLGAEEGIKERGIRIVQTSSASSKDQFVAAAGGGDNTNTRFVIATAQGPQQVQLVHHHISTSSASLNQALQTHRSAAHSPSPAAAAALNSAAPAANAANANANSNSNANSNANANLNDKVKDSNAVHTFAVVRQDASLATTTDSNNQGRVNEDDPDDDLSQESEEGILTVTINQNDSIPSNTSSMIDATDSRMFDPGCSYTTLTSPHNGRMTPTGYISSSYATLTPLQPLPPISTISNMQDKFPAYSPGSNVSGTFVMQNNLPNLPLGSPYNSYEKLGMSPPPPYGHHPSSSSSATAAAAAAAAAAAMGGMASAQQSHSPSALSPVHSGYHQHGPSKQEPLSPSSANYYDPSQRPSPHDLSPNSLEHSPNSAATSGGGYGSNSQGALTSNNNPALNGSMASISPQNISPVPAPPRELSPPSPPSGHTLLHHGGAPLSSNSSSVTTSLSTAPVCAIISTASSLHSLHQSGQPGMNHPGHAPGPPPPMLTLKSSGANSNNSSSGGSNGGGETEEINTKDLAQRISAELKRYSIPQAIFAQRVLCRSQGTLSDLLRNPKPWSKLKSGRETFRRMAKWLQEPEFQRMSALRLAVMQQSATEKERGRSGESHHPHHTHHSAVTSSAKNRRKLPYSHCPPPHCLQEERRISRAHASPQETSFGLYGPPTSYTPGYF